MIAIALGDSYLAGKIHRTAVALSRVQPGQLAYYGLHGLGVLDVLSEQVLWQCPNPLADAEGTPEEITPLPGDKIWAKFHEKSFVVDAQGQVSQLRPYGWEPELYAGAIA